MIDTQYEELLKDVLENGTAKEDRTGTGVISKFGAQLRYDLSRGGFPVITTKRVHLKSVIGELLWFLSGSTNTAWLKENGISIWDEWADENGDLGPIYGKQWRAWESGHCVNPGQCCKSDQSDENGQCHKNVQSVQGGKSDNPDHSDNCGDSGQCVKPCKNGQIDQIANLINTVRTNPESRRMIVSAWNVGELDDMALTPCHAFFQVYIADGKLSLQVYQRSADLFLGVPFNITSYALLTHMLAQQTGYEPGELIWAGGDVHIYSNHVKAVKKQLSRYPFPFPDLMLRKTDSIFDYGFEDIRIVDYQHHPGIKAKVAV